MIRRSLFSGFVTWAAAQDEGVSLLQVTASKKEHGHGDQVPMARGPVARPMPVSRGPVARPTPVTMPSPVVRPAPEVIPSEEEGEEPIVVIQPPPNAAGDTRAASGAIPGTHDLKFTELAENDLSGSGMRFSSCTEKQGRSVDCIVKASGGYVAAKPAKNGKRGNLGNINLKNDASGTFTFSFVDSETDESVALNEFYFSLFDMDTGNGWSTGFENGPAENLDIAGYKYLYKLPVDKNGTISEAEDKFTAQEHGTEADNPTDPFLLTTEQVARTLQFIFPAGKTEFSFTYHNEKPGPGESHKGRNVLFGGMSALYMCKVKKLNFDFEMAEVVRNNLGGHGPDFDAAEGIVYKNVAIVGDQPVDLEINAVSNYTVFNTERNGLNGKYGQINLQTGTDVDLKFKLYIGGTENTYTADWLYFSVFDFDHNKDPTLWQEFMTIANFSSYSLSDNTAVEVTELGEGAYTFSSTIRGTGLDNPTDPLGLDAEQKSKSVGFIFHDVSSFQMKLKVGPPAFKPGKKKKPDGRNFLFAGKSSNSACEMDTYQDVVNSEYGGSTE